MWGGAPWGGGGGGNPGVMGAGSLWEAGEEGAGGGISKRGGSQEKWEKFCNICTIFCNRKSTRRQEPLRKGAGTGSAGCGRWEVQNPCPPPPLLSVPHSFFVAWWNLLVISGLIFWGGFRIALVHLLLPTKYRGLRYWELRLLRFTRYNRCLHTWRTYPVSILVLTERIAASGDEVRKEDVAWDQCWLWPTHYYFLSRRTVVPSW